jgi:hypothetical protein
MPIPPPGSPQAPGYAAPPRAVSRAPVDSGASFSSPPHGSPLGLIAIVLIVDLALAGTGAFLLAKGLSKPATTAAAVAKPPQK